MKFDYNKLFSLSLNIVSVQIGQLPPVLFPVFINPDGNYKLLVYYPSLQLIEAFRDFI